MILHQHEQGSDAWRASRSGVITASMFSTARYKTKKGEWSSDARKYAFRLALERLGGEPLDEGFQTWAMKRGKELEPRARDKIAARLGVEIGVPGFCTTDDGLFGASADGFIGTDKGLEIKCLVDPDRISTVLVSDDISEFEDQIQGGMWITGRSSWYYALYLPQLDKAGRCLYLREVRRNENYIADLERDLRSFNDLVNSALDNLKQNIPEEGKEMF